ncbi:hypothetical protein TSUD_188470 [Trifolium subterraneum]|uniref:Uncharacterized protein n=1 Tax=Trifolium subterraneum TaxID=3900 RepID=A0A2Z6NEC8_TRISU|nr:hypothetical protein TSUD_188470 [Trifolium subterraneum]
MSSSEPDYFILQPIQDPPTPTALVVAFTLTALIDFSTLVPYNTWPKDPSFVSYPSRQILNLALRLREGPRQGEELQLSACHLRIARV